MPYRLELRGDVRAYLRGVPLTREGRVRMNAGLVEMAREVPDAFRTDPANRPSPDTPLYHFERIFEDGGRYWKLYVVLDDSSAPYGVLRVVYAQCD